MYKKGLVLGLVFLFLFCLPCFAQKQQESMDEFVITTYYPSPYGSYNQLEVYRSLRYNPVDKDDPKYIPKEGELVYNASDDSLYLYNGSKWVAQGGGGASYTAWGTTKCADGWTTAYTGYITYATASSKNGIAISSGYCSAKAYDNSLGSPSSIILTQGLQREASDQWENPFYYAYKGREVCAVCVK